MSSSSGVVREARKSVRFRLSVPVIFRWIDESGRQREYVGRTRDLSIAGVFVVSKILPQIRTKCSLEVYLPPLEVGASQQLLLRTEGRVRRVESQGVDIGFAASGSFTLAEL